MLRSLAPLLAAALLAVSACGGGAPGSGSATEPTAAPGWSYQSGDGKTYTAERIPTRIIAHAYAAKALLESGIRPIGIWADAPLAEDVGLRGADFTGIDVLGETWGEIDVEKAAALAPDLIVGDWWPVENAYSGLESGVKEESKKLAQLAPVVGPAQGSSVVDLIEGYRELARSLGADVDSGPAAEARDRFERARAAFETAARAKQLQALAISPYEDKYAVAVPAHAPELLDLTSWGLTVITPQHPDVDFPYWESLSFEKADTYQPDLLLFDDRNAPGGRELLDRQPIAGSIKAYAAGQTTEWPAYWLHSYRDYAGQLERLTGVIEQSRKLT